MRTLFFYHRFFSLVELLIVVSILAILMSLLTPSLNRMTYLSEMLQCKNNLKNIGTGVFVYADDYNDTYPVPTNTDGSPKYKSDTVSAQKFNSSTNEANDWEPLLESAFGLTPGKRALHEIFTCPTMEGYKLKETNPGEHTDDSTYFYRWGRFNLSLYFSSYNLLFSTKWHEYPDEWKIMRRIGDGYYYDGLYHRTLAFDTASLTGSSHVFTSNHVPPGHGNSLPTKGSVGWAVYDSSSVFDIN